MNEVERLTLRHLAALLRYPDDDLALAPFGGEGERVLDMVPAASALVLRSFLRRTGGPGVTGAVERLRRDYVQTFDFDSTCNPHLAWHRYGDRPELGRALAGLNELYRDAGFESAPGELPDYLPRLLEFVAVAPDWAGAVALDGFGDALRTVADNVSAKHPDSAYAPLLVLTLRLLGLTGQTTKAGQGSETGKTAGDMLRQVLEQNARATPKLALQAAPVRRSITAVRLLALDQS